MLKQRGRRAIFAEFQIGLAAPGDVPDVRRLPALIAAELRKCRALRRSTRLGEIVGDVVFRSVLIEAAFFNERIEHT